MSATNGPEDPDVLRAEATAWFVRVQSDVASEQDWLALEAWLTSSPARQAAFDEVERLWSDLDDHAAALQPTPVHEAVVIDFAARRAKPRSAARWGPIRAVAASVVLAALVGAWLLRPTGPAPEVFATSAGQHRSVVLADGSRLLLNSATRVVARVDPRHRSVTLEAGEAVFDVARDHAHPFVVSVGDQRVTVVGTEFDILRHDGRIAVTVSRGAVEVRLARAGVGAQKAMLGPGEQSIHREGDLTSTVINAQVGDAFAWRNGYVVYRNLPLAEVASDLSRYFATPIRVEGEAGRLTFSGAIVIDDEDAVIRRLQSFLPITVDRTPGRITLRRAGSSS